MGLLEDRPAWDHLVDQANPIGFLRRDHVAGQDHLDGLALAHEAGQSLCAAPSRDNAQIDLWLPQPGPVGADAHVARHRQLQPTAEAKAVDSGDDWFGRCLDLEKGPVPSLDEFAGAGLVGAFELRLDLWDICPGDKGVCAPTGDDDRLDVILGHQFVDGLLQLGHNLCVKGVDRRVVDRQHCDSIGDLGSDVLPFSHLFASFGS